jgi:hypothetical protein
VCKYNPVVFGWGLYKMHIAKSLKCVEVEGTQIGWWVLSEKNLN